MGWRQEGENTGSICSSSTFLYLSSVTVGKRTNVYAQKLGAKVGFQMSFESQ